jgi:hypothetical protein
MSLNTIGIKLLFNNLEIIAKFICHISFNRKTGLGINLCKKIIESSKEKKKKI